MVGMVRIAGGVVPSDLEQPANNKARLTTSAGSHLSFHIFDMLVPLSDDIVKLLLSIPDALIAANDIIRANCSKFGRWVWQASWATK